MNVTEYLRRYERADRKAQRLLEEYKRENELVDAVRSTADIDGLPKGTGISKETEEKALRLADKAALFKMAQLDALHERQEVANTIFKVKDPDEQDVLVERYINYGQTWEEICVKLHMSWGTVHNKHRQAKTTVAVILNTKSCIELDI